MIANGVVFVNASTPAAARNYARELGDIMRRRDARVRDVIVSDNVRVGTVMRRDAALEVDVRVVVDLDAPKRVVREFVADVSADATDTLASDHGTFALALWNDVE